MNFIDFITTPYLPLGDKWLNSTGNFWKLAWQEDTLKLMAVEYTEEGYTGNCEMLGYYNWRDIRDITGVTGGTIG